MQDRFPHAESDDSGGNQKSIIDKAIRGDSDAFDQLVRRYSPRLLRMANGLVGNQQDAEDLVQEAFVKALVHLNSFAGKSSFFTRLYRITINQSTSQRRKRRLESTHNSRHLDCVPSPISKEVAVDQKLQTDEETCQLRQAISRLDDERRTVFCGSAELPNLKAA